MGRLVLEPEILGDSLFETVGYKSGLALSVQEMCDHLQGTGYDDILAESEARIITLRSEEYEELFYKVLHKVGYTDEEFNGDLVGVALYHKYKHTELISVYMGVQQLYIDIMPELRKIADKRKNKALDPGHFINAANRKFGMPWCQDCSRANRSYKQKLNVISLF